MVQARDPITVKLYGNRRLYQPARGRYLTRDELIALAHAGAAVIVHDARSGADLTDFVLSSHPTEHRYTEH